MKLKIWTLVGKTCQRRKKKRSFASKPKKKYNTLSEQGDTGMLTLHDFPEGLKDVCHESVLFSAVPKPDADFVTGLVKHQPGEFRKKFGSLNDWIN